MQATYYPIKQKLLLLLTLAGWLWVSSAAALARPERTVVGYSAVWRDAASPPECYNFDAVTYIARAFLIPRPDGSIEVPPGYFSGSLKNLAKAHGVQLLLSIGGEQQNADNWLSIARHDGYFNRFCDQLQNLLQREQFDGIDIDWEPSATTTPDGQAFMSFMTRLRGRFANKVITAALGASEYWIGHFYWKVVAASVDYVNVMTYDYSGGWGGRADYASNLFPAGAYPAQPTLSVAEGMANLIENHKVPPSKLLLGITFWPSRFRVNHIGEKFPVNGRGYSMNITFADAMCLLHGGSYRDFWDKAAAMPYMERTGGGSVVVYESPRSVGRKCEYADSLKCAGVMIWHLGADLDGDRTPLMDAIADSVGVARTKISADLQRDQITRRQEDVRALARQTGFVLPTGDLALEPAGQIPAADFSDVAHRLCGLWARLQDDLWSRDLNAAGK